MFLISIKVPAWLLCVMGPVLALCQCWTSEEPLIRNVYIGTYLWLFKPLYRNDKLILLVSINPYPFPTPSLSPACTSHTCSHYYSHPHTHTHPHTHPYSYSHPHPHPLTLTLFSHSLTSFALLLASLIEPKAGRGRCDKRSTKMPCESLQTTQKSMCRAHSSACACRVCLNLLRQTSCAAFAEGY